MLITPTTLILFVLAVAIMFGVLGIHWKSRIRSAARLFLGLLFTLSLLATVSLLIASITLSAKGGGVLFLFALPAAVVSWVTGSLFFASIEGEHYYDLSTDEKIKKNVSSLDQTLEDLKKSIIEKTAEKNRFWTSAKRREKLALQIEREHELLEKLPQLREGLKQPEAYEKDEH